MSTLSPFEVSPHILTTVVRKHASTLGRAIAEAVLNSREVGDVLPGQPGNRTGTCRMSAGHMPPAREALSATVHFPQESDHDLVCA